MPTQSQAGPSLWQRARRCLVQYHCREVYVLAALILAAGAIWVFAEIADEVLEQETRAFDRTVLLAMREADDPADPRGSRSIEEMGRDFTALGGVGIGAFVTAAALGYLLLRRKWGATLLVLLAVGGGIVLSLLLKVGFDRPRPDLVPHGSYVVTASFPSGHSMMSAVIYLTLGALLARLHSRRRIKLYFILLAVIVTVLVGVSRVYLGVHWPTDVLAGWAAGAGWAILCWGIALLLQRQGRVEESMELSEPGEDDVAPNF
ncbi:MAG: phosphatase PAP2 family protein [Phycisphaerae bacterium]